jgi:glycosyltransferase involved in cell wall biosynthesis
MINLLHVSPNKYKGLNSSDHTYKIWKELSKGVDNYYILARSEKNKFERFENDNITLILIPKIINQARIFIFTSFIVFFYIRKFKITHVLCQSAIFGGFACIMAKKIFNVSVMLEIHGEEYFRIMDSKKTIIKIFALILRYVYRSADKVRSLNEYMTEKLIIHGISKNVVEIYNRVNLELFKEVKVNFKASETFKLVSVGRFVKEKNYENLIIYLKNSGIKFHLTLIGGGVLKDNYNSIIQRFDLSNDVILIDWIEQKEMIKTLLESDLYIQSSISEGMPRTIVEAMALQMPIVSTNVGSIRGVIKNEVNGLLVEPNELSIISAIKKMIELESLRESLARQGRNDVIEKYEWNSVFNKYRNEISTM